MNDGVQPNGEWVTLLSSTNNQKITQRGRYLEVNIYEIVNLIIAIYLADQATSTDQKRRRHHRDQNNPGTKRTPVQQSPKNIQLGCQQE